jgi:hypothetical protein
VSTHEHSDDPLDTTGDANGDDSLTVDDGEVIETDREEVLVRRAPRYWRFIGAGAILGVVVALILTFAFPPNESYSPGVVFGFLVLLCGVIGVAIGAVIALVLDRRSNSRAATRTVEHSSRHPLD